ncbi:MAG: 6,7-dimethyl-8-ribityllumazine synthase, partial [Actinobacteria bacterium]|nr:6,7-dimethyl-8-ribityllumazine synthase [Actinomycetota bacterium]
MAGQGSPDIVVDGKGFSIVVIAGSWHDEITNGLIAGAIRVLETAGAMHSLIRVPGAFELPLVAQTALRAGADAVVCLGVIIRGGTPHFDFVSNAATDGLTRVALDEGKPVGFGVLTLDD